MKHYSERDIMELDRNGNYYTRHVSAMTSEKLHSKSDIAAELGFRDAELDRLRDQNKRYHNAIVQLTHAISRIDYLLGSTNEMQLSEYDVHANENAVVERVHRLRADVEELERLLRNAKCPNESCIDGVIAYGPDPDGNWESQQCQWCAEKEAYFANVDKNSIT